MATPYIKEDGANYNLQAGLPLGGTATLQFTNDAGATIATLAPGVYTLASDSGVVHIAGTETITGAKTFSAITTISNATASSSTATGALVVTGGLGVGGAAYIGGIANLTSGTASTTNTTGALVVTGGAGISGAVFTGGAIRTNSVTVSSSVSTGALISDGGLGVAGAAYIGGIVNATSGTASSSATTGSLVVTGGLGVSGSGFFGARLNVNTSNANPLILNTTAANGGYLNFQNSGVDAGYLGSGSNTVTGAALADFTFACATGALNLATSNTIRLSVSTGGNVSITIGTASTTSATGALVVTGGVGIGGAVFTAGAIRTNSTTTSSSVTTGALISDGGLGVAGTATIGGTTTFNSNIVQSNTMSGASSSLGISAITTFQNTAGANRAVIGVAIANASGASTASTIGFESRADLNGNSANIPSGDFVGLNPSVRINSGTAAGTVGNAYGVSSLIANQNASVTITTGIGVLVSAPQVTGPITTCYGINIGNQSPVGVTTGYGIYVASQTSGAIAIQTNTGIVKFLDSTASTTTTTGALIVSGGVGVGGTITLDGSTAKVLRYTNGTANAAVAVTFGAVGPTGSTAGNQVGWVRINVAGTDRYVPFW